MNTELNTLKFSLIVNSPPDQVYRAFTRSPALRQWLCDSAQADARVNGRLYLWWLSDYYATGEFKTLIKNKEITFSWLGKGEPTGTLVNVQFREIENGTDILLEHGNIGKNNGWSEITEKLRRGWDTSLENLKSVLETGKDLRFIRRPMLGIVIGEFTQAIAKELDAPVIHGVRVNSVIEGMGAFDAGIMRDDIIVSMANFDITEFSSLSKALQSNFAGDRVEVVFYRGPIKKTVTMELSSRPMPKIPATAEILANELIRKYEKAGNNLSSLLEGITDENASYQPSPGDWSIKETLAHLIINEREWQSWIADIINDDERWSDDFANPTNVLARLSATLAAYPTTERLLETLRLSQLETTTMIAAVPPDLVERKGSFFNLAFNLLESEFHFDTHMQQITNISATISDS